MISPYFFNEIKFFLKVKKILIYYFQNKDFFKYESLVFRIEISTFARS